MEMLLLAHVAWLAGSVYKPVSGGHGLLGPGLLLVEMHFNFSSFWTL